MKNFSSGLLYSVAPEYLPRLHIDDEDQADVERNTLFSWQQDDDWMAESVTRVLKMAAKGFWLTRRDK